MGQTSRRYEVVKIKSRVSTAILLIMIFSIVLAAIVQRDKAIKTLSSEVEGLEIRKEELLKQKKLYEELNFLYEELEENLGQQIKLLETNLNNLEKKQSDLEKENREIKKSVSRGTSRGEFIITAYDNSPASQGKWVNQTATGFNLKGHTLESARCIAVDPNVIPLGSKVQLTFDKAYSHLNGVYTAYDTGGAIKGRKIDLFFGDGVDRAKVMKFGKRKVQVKVLGRDS